MSNWNLQHALKGLENIQFHLNIQSIWISRQELPGCKCCVHNGQLFQKVHFFKLMEKTMVELFNIEHDNSIVVEIIISIKK